MANAAKRSYYDILELKPNFMQKELRKHFLMKGKVVLKQQESSIPITTSQMKLLSSSNCSRKPTRPSKTLRNAICTILEWVRLLRKWRQCTTRK
jgi:hypothetical protein